MFDHQVHLTVFFVAKGGNRMEQPFFESGPYVALPHRHEGGVVVFQTASECNKERILCGLPRSTV